jgi:circadian clock protein KaiC
VLPITSVGLVHKAGRERISSGVERLDTMLGGKGYYCGSSILVSGTAGTGKSSVAASFVDAACRRGKKCLYLAFEESENQIVRNMASIGIDLQCWTKKNLLRFHTARPTASGLEVHLVSMFSEISAFSPEAVVIDPITNFVAVGSTSEVKSMMARLIDHLKYRRVTTMFTNLTHAGFSTQEQTSSEVSSLMDTWILLRDIEMNGERNRGLYVLKSRGMRHSNQIREFLITDNGIDLRDVYVGPGGFLMGSARAEKEIQERTSAELRDLDMRRKKQVLEGRRKALDAQIAALKAEIAEIEEEAGTVLSQERQTAEGRKEERQELGRIRGADAASRGGKKGKGERR